MDWRVPSSVAALVLVGAASAATPKPAPAPAPPTVEVEDAAIRGELPTAWGQGFGDLDAIRKRGVLRALVVPGHLAYFVQEGRQHGAQYEWLVAFEKQLNADRQRGQVPIRVAIVPTSTDRIVADLLEGRGDVAAYSLTVTPSRAKQVDFVAHIVGGRRKIVVTRDDVPELASLDALGDRELWVRRNSSGHEQAVRYNQAARAAGRRPLKLRVAPPHLIDEDLIQLVDSGIAPAAITYGFKAEVFGQVLHRIRAHPKAELAHDEEFAWAVRKGSPSLKAELDRFWKRNAVGSKLGNIIVDRYIKRGMGLHDPTAAAERRKYEQMVAVFRKHSARYDMDHLLMLAQGYQESQLEQHRRSPVGAVGVMQLMPATGKQMKVGDITQLEPNVHGGVKYMRWIMDHHFTDPGIAPTDKVLFAFAGYNAGPTRINKMRAEAARRGLDRNRWFGNVEVVTAQRVGREPVDYVANIYKYYLAYTLIAEQEAKRAAARRP